MSVFIRECKHIFFYHSKNLFVITIPFFYSFGQRPPTPPLRIVIYRI